MADTYRFQFDPSEPCSFQIQKSPDLLVWTTLFVPELDALVRAICSNNCEMNSRLHKRYRIDIVGCEVDKVRTSRPIPAPMREDGVHFAYPTNEFDGKAEFHLWPCGNIT